MNAPPWLRKYLSDGVGVSGYSWFLSNISGFFIDIQLRKKRSRTGRPAALSDRAVECLLAAWRYQSLGTRALHRLVAADSGDYAFSKELLKLEAKGLLFGEKDLHNGFSWSITPTGFFEIHPRIAERYGPASPIECSVSEVQDRNLCSRWYRRNNRLLVFTELLKALSPFEGVGSTEERLLSCAGIKARHPWLPKMQREAPDVFLRWDEGEVIALKYVFLDLRSQRIEETLRSLLHGKKTRVFLILENLHGQQLSAKHLSSVFEKLNDRDSARVHLVEASRVRDFEFESVTTVGRKKPQGLVDVVGVNPPAPVAAVELAKLIEDLTAKTKVWGRAYQR